MNHNKKGFTLVEIIVSIALASIILMLVGTIIVTSSGLLTNSSKRDSDKRIVDSIIEYVRGEIEYSTDIRLVDTNSKYVPDVSKDKNWHYFYVKDGTLYRDGVQVFNKDFYSNCTFIMTAKGDYNSSQRLDIKYSLDDNDGEVYTSRDTVMLLNLTVSEEIQKNALYTGDYVNLTDTEYKIYYNKKYVAPTDDGTSSDTDYTGTVADIQNNIGPLNCAGLYIGKSHYAIGEIVYYNDKWWECVINTKEKPGSTIAWKCLYSGWTSPGARSDGNYGGYSAQSAYEKGDVVIYNGLYYQANKNLTYITTLSDTDAWKVISEKAAKKVRYEKKNVYRNDNLLTKTSYYKISNIDFSDPTHASVEVFDERKNYPVGSVVRRTPTNSFYNNNPYLMEPNYYPIYIKIFNPAFEGYSPGNSGESGWMLFEIKYYQKSSYDKDVIVLGTLNDNQLVWIKSRNVIKIDNSLTNENIGDTYWSIP